MLTWEIMVEISINYLKSLFKEKCQSMLYGINIVSLLVKMTKRQIILQSFDTKKVCDLSDVIWKDFKARSLICKEWKMSLYFYIIYEISFVPNITQMKIHQERWPKIMSNSFLKGKIIRQWIWLFLITLRPWYYNNKRMT